MEMLKLVELESYAARYPHQLSGGERQRIALARALAPRPALLLLDEPYSSLDNDLRIQIREQVRSILKELQVTAIFVTHDQEEALYMGDRLVVFQNGIIQQMGTPEEVFHSSQTRFVAEFMGSSDMLPGVASAHGIETPLGLLLQIPNLPIGTSVDVSMRADDVDFVPDSTGNAVIEERLFQGAFYLYSLRLTSNHSVHALKIHTDLFEVGTRVTAFISAQHPLSVFHQGISISMRTS
jgi:iron(III) transport system ATP-binding protein